MSQNPKNPRHSPDTSDTALLQEFVSPALSPEEAEPRERHGRPDEGLLSTCATGLSLQLQSELGDLILGILDMFDRSEQLEQEAARRGITLNQLQAAAITSAVIEHLQAGSANENP